MKALNVKNMKETLVNYCGGSEDEYNKIYSVFWEMATMGFISDKDWRRFFDDTHAWTISGDYLIDTSKGDFGTLVFDFNNGRDGSDYRPYKA